MLSLAAMKNGQCEYYQALAKEDYYLSGGEPPGYWLGEGARRLGLSGRIKTRELAALFRGFSCAGMKLVQNAGKPNRQPGWDLTFSAPKSVSILWSQLGREQQRQIQAAHAAAVEATIGYIEKNYAYSRIGRGGSERIRTGLVVAAFEHSCSRALDPQLHTHALVMNLGVDGMGISRSILSRPLYQVKMLAGAYYRCELAHQLQVRLGVGIERPINREGNHLGWFEVKGVPKGICQHFSKRRAAIETALGSRGLESASAAAFAALTTREPKSLVPPRNELHARWKEEGLHFGFEPELLISSVSDYSLDESRERYQAALTAAVGEITQSENYFTQEVLTRRVLEAAQELSLEAALVAEAVGRDLQNNSLFVSVGSHQGQMLWTTQEILELEREFLESVEALRQRRFSAVPEKIVAATLSQKVNRGDESFFLDPEQQAAVRYLCQSPESIKIVSGYAGTGKTEMLAAAKEALEKSGYRVIGAALSNVASRTLQEKTGIESDTIRMRERQLESTFGGKLEHHAHQMIRAALGKPTWPRAPFKIDAKTVLVVDEASLVSTQDFTMLAKVVVNQGGSLIAVGDHRQLPAIERGGCFDHLVKSLEGSELTEIRRQQDPVDRDAIKNLLAGRPAETLEHFACKGQLFVGQSTTETELQLVTDWRKNGGAEKPAEHRIFAGTRAEVARFNQLCQAERIQTGQVDPTQRVEHDDLLFMVGDAVRFNTAVPGRGIAKGEQGTVIACQQNIWDSHVAVALQREADISNSRAMETLKHHGVQLLNAALGRATESLPPRHDIVVVPLKSLNPLTKCYEGLALDYALTTHRGQSQTVANSYVLLGGKMTDRELSYVQSSRHREKLHLYASEQETGRHLTELARQYRPVDLAVESYEQDIPKHSSLITQMAQSRAKRLASSLQEELPISQGAPCPTMS
jgi:conjugative relaxase-like TrwC/TraI family protein